MSWGTGTMQCSARFCFFHSFVVSISSFMPFIPFVLFKFTFYVKLICKCRPCEST
jgi:hypothetical protein